MRQDYKTLFSTLGSEVPDKALLPTINMRIKHAQVRQARIRFFSVSIVSLVSLVSLVPVWQYVGSEMQTSGFSSYLSALISSGQSALVGWKDFGLVLLESLPIFGTALLLVTILAFLGSLRIAIKNAFTARLSF
jgi:hypothetical protein